MLGPESQMFLYLYPLFPLARRQHLSLREPTADFGVAIFFKDDIRKKRWARVGEIIVFWFSFHSSGGKEVKTQMEEEKILYKMQPLPGLKLKKIYCLEFLMFI